MDVFLSLYVLPAEKGKGASMLPFLLVADDEDAAIDVSDAFVNAVETLANPMIETHVQELARTEIETLRDSIVMIEDQDHFTLITDCLREHNPDFEKALKTMIGSVFTVEVTEESGFSLASANILRNEMSGHYVVSNLSVELI